MKHRILFAILLAFCFSQIIFAQNSKNSEVVSQLCKEKVAQLNDYISFMASKKKSVEDRKYYKTKALNLFIGKGLSYEDNGVVKEGVTVEICYLSRNREKKVLVRNFFDQVIALGYKNVRIISAEVANVYYVETAEGQVPYIMLGNIAAEIKDN